MHRKKKLRLKVANARPRSRIITVAAVVVALACATLVLAQLQRRWSSKAQLTPAGLSATTPAKEFYHLGGRLIATSTPTVSTNGDDAAFVSQNTFYLCGHYPNRTDLVQITMRNSGTTTWTALAGYKLGSENPANNTSWGLSRVALPASIPPGSTVLFNFIVTGSGLSCDPPPSPETYTSFQWQMVKDSAGGPSWFGEMTSNIEELDCAQCLPSGLANHATVVSTSVPLWMLAGQNYPVSVTMANAGTNTWTSGAGYKLGSQNPQDNTYWGLNRVALPASVGPGSNATFNFTAAASATPGRYNFQWMMVQDGGAGFFGALTDPIGVAVTSKAAMGYLDYELDGKTDVAVWRPSSGQWLIDTNRNGTVDLTYTFSGNGGTLPVPGDYNGDGKADLAMLKQSSANWSFDFDRNGTSDQTVAFGLSTDIPCPHQYSSDKQTDIAMFRPSTGQWIVDTNRAARPT